MFDIKIKFLLIIFVFLNSCAGNDEFKEISKKSKKTVLILMEANNDLKYEAFSSINRMESSLPDSQNLIVYINSDDYNSHLIRIVGDKDPYRVKSDTIKTFKKDKSNLLNLDNAIESAKSLFGDIYGLILWSHATSWAKPSKQNVKTKSFGNDNDMEIDIRDLANILPHVEYLIFDACSMGSVEVIYEFKDKAKYIIASPSETLAESLPYHLITPFLFEDINNLLKKVCMTYFNYYNSYDDLRKSATISLYQTDKFNVLAEEVNKVYTDSSKELTRLSTDNIQRLDFTFNFPIPVYDFNDYFIVNFQQNDLTALSRAMNNFIVFKAYTPSFLGIRIKSFSGLSIYIPNGKFDPNLEYYKTLKWYKDSGVEKLLN
ncbi:clostripain-related cysteine peptidase [Sphingobacterium spiritivorum]|uniref:clostripain-related cysteine peptidase n=2 Tax=Sphingobacterium spiritivorum TaxID=258 RepID=UPI003DA62BE2